MKSLRRMFGCALALCLMGAVTAAAFGQAAVADPDEKGTIVINKYAVDDLDDHDAPATGEVQDITGLEPIPNIGFTITRMDDDETDPNGDAPEGAYSATVDTDKDGRAEFPNLDHGVYRIHEEPSAAVLEPVDDFLVSVPMTNPAGTGWLYTVNVYPKNRLIGLPGVDLFVTNRGNKSDSVALGGPVTWIAATEIPADIGSAKGYAVETAPSEYLSYVDDSVTAYTETSGGGTIQLEAENDYTFVPEEDRWMLDVTAAGRTKLAGAVQEGFVPVLYTQYVTALDIPAQGLEAALGEQVENVAQLRYTGALGADHTITMDGEVTPYVYTGGIQIQKVDGKSGQQLTGAMFKIYRTLEEAKAGQNPVKEPGGAEDWEVTTAEEGKAYFHGLAYGGAGIPAGEGETAYYLVETRAPVGYNLLRAPVEVKVNATSHREGNAVTVRDNTGFTLPSTGGAGTLWFTVGGLALVGLAVFLYLRSRKKRRGAR